MKKQQQEKESKINIYRFSEEAVEKHLGGYEALREAFDKKKAKPKKVYTVETKKETVEITNQAFADIKKLYGQTGIECYDMYVAKNNYLDRDEVMNRMQIADGGTSDWFYDAKPEIDWKAEELTDEQILSRCLFLAKIAEMLEKPEIARELLTFMPNKVRGGMVKGRVTKIATANIVTKEARIFELLARALTETNVVICAESRPFKKEEAEEAEKDFLSTHLPVFGLDTITELPKQESEETVYVPETVTIYKPATFNWEKKPRDEYTVISKRYDGIKLCFSSIWALSKRGYPYERAVSEVEQISIAYEGILWAPLQDFSYFPYEEPFDGTPVILGEIELNKDETERKRFSANVNRFFYLMDKTCLLDAIENHNLSALQERERFLSPENIDACIQFAEQEKAEDCLTWLQSRRDAVLAAKTPDEPYGYLDELLDNKQWLSCAEEWMNTYDDLLEQDPEIVFEGKRFVDSGLHEVGELYNAVKERGGVFRTTVSGITDYLIVDPSHAGSSKSWNAREKHDQGKPVKIVLVQDKGKNKKK